MSCKCKTKIIEGIDQKEIFKNKINYETLTKPFETCPLCALKHIGNAIVNQNKIYKCITEVYLAYKHLEKYFKDEAKECFKFIEEAFKMNYDTEKLEDLTNKIHNLAIKYNDDKNTDEIIEGEPLNLEENLKPFFKCGLYILTACELYNFEVGYRDVNTPYVIGLLQQAAEECIKEDENSIILQKEALNIRDLWKKIENNEKISLKEFYFLASKKISYQIHDDKNK